MFRRVMENREKYEEKGQAAEGPLGYVAGAPNSRADTWSAGAAGESSFGLPFIRLSELF